MPFDHFDLLAPIYERVIPPAVTESMLRELDPGPNCRLLDAGGGTGRVSGFLQEHVGSVVLTLCSYRDHAFHQRLFRLYPSR